ncbi:MAG: hypothetical protein IME99_10200 [Proteobacteria bacterium]|nr:hypothetical protein [Pseudomonadota bacterium]
MARHRDSLPQLHGGIYLTGYDPVRPGQGEQRSDYGALAAEDFPAPLLRTVH